MKIFYGIVFGQVLSLFGNAALRFALPLWLLRQSGSAALYGAVTAFAMLPALAGTLAGGTLADRSRKLRMMAVLDLVTTGISLSTAALLGLAPPILLSLAVLGALYAVQGLYQPAVRACLPLLLAPEQLVRGNAIVQLVDTADELLGPLLGSFLLELCGLRGLLVLCGGCFVGSAVLEMWLHFPQDCLASVEKRPLLSDLHDTMCTLRTEQPEVLRLAGMMALVNLLVVPAVTIGVPVAVVQFLGRSDTALGLAQAFLSAGGLAGGALSGVLAGKLPPRHGLWALYGLCGCCAGMGLALLVPAAYAGLCLGGFGFMAAATVFNIWFYVRLQRLVPQARLGRVTACLTVLACLPQPVGQLVYGRLFEQLPACPAVVLLGAGAVCAAAVFHACPRVKTGV